jgi:hypothetical protein
MNLHHHTQSAEYCMLIAIQYAILGLDRESSLIHGKMHNISTSCFHLKFDYVSNRGSAQYEYLCTRVQCVTVQYSMVQYVTVQYGAVRYSVQVYA